MTWTYKAFYMCNFDTRYHQCCHRDARLDNKGACVHAVRQACHAPRLKSRHCALAEFVKLFRPHVSSTVNDPNFPSDFLPKSAKEESEAPTTVPDKLTLNFFLPHETTMKDSKVRHRSPMSRVHSHSQRENEYLSTDAMTHTD